MYRGAIKDGKEEGPWVGYWENGRLMYKGAYKNGKKHGCWVTYNEDGTLNLLFSGTYTPGDWLSDQRPCH